MGVGRQPSQSRGIDPVVVVAVICVAIGWFLLSTLDTRLGGMRLAFRFYNMWSVLEHPPQLVTGLGGDSRLKAVVFGAACLALLGGALLASSLTPVDPRHRSGTLLSCAPLALMLACGLLLYQKTSADLFTSTDPSSTIRSHLTALANTLANGMSSRISRHITLGLGAYLSFAGSVVLAARGALELRGRSGAGSGER